MARFIIQTLIVVSLGAILYLMARALPRVGDEPGNAGPERSRLMFYMEKLDEILKSFMEKILRQVRVWILKIDNFVGKKLNRFKKESPKETKLPPAEEDKSPEA